MSNQIKYIANKVIDLISPKTPLLSKNKVTLGRSLVPAGLFLFLCSLCVLCSSCAALMGGFDSRSRQSSSDYISTLSELNKTDESYGPTVTQTPQPDPGQPTNTPTPTPTPDQDSQSTSQITPTETPTQTPTPTQTVNPRQQEVFNVTKVVDGDTIKVNYYGTEKSVRLIGINTPETVDPRKPVECFGREASNKMKELLAGQRVILEADPTQGDVDRHGRLLRYVYREHDKLFINLYMIEQGFAFEYTYSVPYKHQSRFREAQNIARNEQRGLWHPDTCNGEVKPAGS